MTPRIQNGGLWLFGTALIAVVFAAAAGCGPAKPKVEPPQDCRDCHVKMADWVEHETSGHKDAECAQCHVPHGMMGPEEPEQGAEVAKPEVVLVEGACESCHQEQLDDNTAHGHHAKHISCLRCHGQGIHRFKPPAEICRECHMEMVVLAPAMTKNHCTSCHDFVRQPIEQEPERLPSREDCLKCHRSAVEGMAEEAASAFFDDRAHGQMACARCHQPHQSKDPPNRDTCLGCHAVDRFGGTPPHDWGFHLAKCTSCHQPHNFAPEAAVAGEPVYMAAVKGHSPGSQAKKFRLNAEGKVNGSDCASCHNFAKYTASVNTVGHPGCISCHRKSTFGFRGDQSACGKCHTVETGVLNSRGHTSCEQCHTAHAWAGPGESRCDQCHGEVRAMLADISVKSSCLTCHGAHTARLPEVPDLCASCHGDVLAGLFAGADIMRDCRSCHEMHSWEYQPGACGVCHGDKLESTPASLGFKRECTNCHQPHGWSAEGMECTMCHGDIPDQIPAELADYKSDCTMCHQVHTWRPNLDDCTICHSDVVEDAARIEQERYEKLKEQLTAEDKLEELPDGPEPHLKRQCTLCHQPHEWKIDLDAFDCTVCHGEMESGLHYVEGHKDCANCHGGHTWQPRDREICAMCHSDREEHYPGMDCVECHWQTDEE